MLSAQLLSSWLATRSTLGEVASLTSDLCLITTRPVEAGEVILDLRKEALVTPDVVYADREFGRELSTFATRYGPGFGSVALATFFAVERIRGFQAGTWFAGSAAETGNSIGASEYSPLSGGHWSLDCSGEKEVSQELRPIIAQGMELVLPICELAARRAWSSNQLWSEGNEVIQWSRDGLLEVLETSFTIVLSRQWPEPPPYLGKGAEAASAPSAWGFGTGSPTGPAVLPPIRNVFHAHKDEMLQERNAAIGLPPPPKMGNLGEGVSARCVALQRIDQGELVRA
jgi:hypothetical protein